MRILLQELVGNGTTPDLDCPLLTKQNEQDDRTGCAYTDWAYALFAIVALIIVAIPFVAFICYVHRRIQKKHRTRDVIPSTSHESSGAYPYQPLHGDRSGHTNYGAIDSSVDNRQALRSPSHGSTASLTDRLSQQQLDTTSMASSHASIIPTYDDVSLNNRNAIANKTQGDGANRPARKTTGRSSRSSHLSTDSQEKAVDQGGQFYESVDVVSNVPKPTNQTTPKDLNIPPPKPRRQQVVSDANKLTTENHVYDEVEGIIQPPSIADSVVDGASVVDGVPVVNGGPVVDAPSMVPKANDSPGNGNKNSHGSPEYAVLEPFPETPKDSSHTEDTINVNENEQENLSISEQKQSLLSDAFTETADESPPSENKYLTVLPPTPPKQNEPSNEDAGSLQSSEDFDQLSVSPSDKSATKSRTDFEEFLLEKVRNMPANERNGTFLVRDSVSSSGSKVLTMYCWKPDTNKELYNFKVSLKEDGQVYLCKGSSKFSDLNGLLEYLRENKDMLPCVLTTQVFP